jgi:hypothetical protein
MCLLASCGKLTAKACHTTAESSPLPPCLPQGPSWRELPVEKRIEHALIKGIDEFVVADTEEARTCGRYPMPLNVSPRLCLGGGPASDGFVGMVEGSATRCNCR